MDRGAWRAIVHGVAEFDMTERLSTAHHRKENMNVIWSSVPTEYKIFSK